MVVKGTSLTITQLPSGTQQRKHPTAIFTDTRQNISIKEKVWLNVWDNKKKKKHKTS